MAEEKKEEKKKGGLRGMYKGKKGDERNEPKEKTKVPDTEKGKEEPKAKVEGAAVEGKMPGMDEKHAEAREAMHKRHETERRDMHGNHREEHRKMNARHEKEHKDLAMAQDAEVGSQAPGEGTEPTAAGGAMPPAAAAA